METISKSMAGERVTFNQLLADKNFTVEIPIIQRDFAQGRSSTSEIRILFLEALQYHLTNDINIDLDFIYGSLAKELKGSTRFIPLDGQQRLTTLFLLHWYLAHKEDRVVDFRNALLLNDKPKFTYETRSSSREFCEALLSKIIDFTLISEQSTISNIIKNTSWYYQSWNLDPTIKGMLTMLDDIHEMFFNSTGYYEKLVRKENPIITFLFLNLDDFKLTDDLYIKMNARGKSLTEFEIFKAKFEQVIRGLELEQESTPAYSISSKPCTPQDYFSQRIDTVWADLFWSFRNKKTNLFDDELMNFLRTTATNHYADNAAREPAITNVDFLRDRGYYGEVKKISFNKYEEIGCFTRDYIFHLIELLDRLTGNDGKLHQYLDDRFYYDEAAMFAKVISGVLSYTESLQFYGYALYLTSNDDTAGLFDWMRVIHNLTVNTIYNRVDEFINSIKSISRMSANSYAIIQYLSVEANPVDSFLGIQIIEERLKSQLIEKSVDWRNAIISCEKHGYFKGQIGFILKFTGMLDFYNQHKNCKWDAAADKSFFEKFNYYTRCGFAIFSTEGLKKFDGYAWERALLTKGDYLLKKGHNFSFLTDIDREASWKRLLRDNNGGKRDFVKAVFDDGSFTIDNTGPSLQAIIEKSTIGDWRNYIVRDPETIRYCQQRMIRIDSPTQVTLLGQSQLNHYHVDLYSYSLYNFYISNIISEYSPFTREFYHPIKTSEDESLAVIDSWRYGNSNFGLYVFCRHNVNVGVTYYIQFFDRNNVSYPDDVKAILEENKFSLSPDGPYLLQLRTEDSVMDKINLLCSAFNDI